MQSERPAVPSAATGEADTPANNVVRLWMVCPHAETVTGYDRENLTIYALLLQAEFEGASERHMAEAFFAIAFDRNPRRAETVVRSHLARAHWLKEHVYPHFDW
jgi:predicted transposase YbfD/YdcC